MKLKFTFNFLTFLAIWKFVKALEFVSSGHMKPVKWMECPKKLLVKAWKKFTN